MSTPSLTFSGHETFACRQFWLKKGYDHVRAGRSLRDADAIAHLTTPNAERVFRLIAEGYAGGTRAFSRLGTYGTGKSSCAEGK